MEKLLLHAFRINNNYATHACIHTNKRTNKQTKTKTIQPLVCHVIMFLWVYVKVEKYEYMM